MSQISGVMGTCTLGTLYNITGGGYGEQATIASLKKAVKESPYKNLLANTTSETVSNNLTKAGLPKIGEYAGNGGTVYVHATFGKKE